MTGVSMGNPHAVVWVWKMLQGLEIEKTGPMFENHPRFPDRINTEFVRVIDRGLVEMRVWERGSGVRHLRAVQGPVRYAVASALKMAIRRMRSPTLRRGSDCL